MTTSAPTATTAATPARTGIVRAFDGLRCVAILLVVFHHLLPGDVLGGGVETFFVLSGYLITTILLRDRTRSARIDYRRFLRHRLFRLYPALLVMVAVVAAGLVLAGRARFALEQSAVALTYLFDLYLPLTGRPFGAMGHTWSLGLEQQFYLTWPLVVLLLAARIRRPGGRFAVVAALAVAGIGLQIAFAGQASNFSPPARMAPLLVGCALAFGLAWRRAVPHRAWLWAAAAVFAVMTVLVDVAHVLPHDPVRPVATVCAAVAVWVLATAGDRGVGLLTNRVAVHLGLISYGLFLWHYPTFWFLFHLTDVPLWVTAAVGLPVTLALAEITRRAVELPALRRRDDPLPRLIPGWARRPRRELPAGGPPAGA